MSEKTTVKLGYRPDFGPISVLPRDEFFLNICLPVYINSFSFYVKYIEKAIKFVFNFKGARAQKHGSKSTYLKISFR